MWVITDTVLGVSETNIMGTWTNIRPFYHANNTTQPPLLLRDEPNQNYLSHPSRNAGFVLVFFTILLIVFAISLEYMFVTKRKQQQQQNNHYDNNNNNNTTVHQNNNNQDTIQQPRRIEPWFFVFLAIGSTFTVLSIVPLTFDENIGLDDSDLDKSCNIMLWLVTIGHYMTYCVLLSKVKDFVFSFTAVFSGGLRPTGVLWFHHFRYEGLLR